MDKPIVYFLVGVPGQGKTTYINNNLLSTGDFFIASSDDIIIEKGNELGLSYNDAYNKFIFSDIENELYEKIKIAVSEKKNIIVDRTNLTMGGRGKILKLITSDYYKVAILFMYNRTKIAENLKKREAETGKYIKPLIVEKMLSSFDSPTRSEFDKIIVI